MKLRKGLKVTIGYRTWSEEIPDKVFAEITKMWPRAKAEEFRKRHEAKAEKEPDPPKKDKK